MKVDHGLASRLRLLDHGHKHIQIVYALPVDTGDGKWKVVGREYKGNPRTIVMAFSDSEL